MMQPLNGFCVLAVFCGAALRLAPEGTVRRVMSVLVSAILLLQLFTGIGLEDLESIPADLGRIREAEQRFRQESGELRERLDRLVIEEELRTYIQNKAEQHGVQISEVELELRWQTEGYWLPWSLKVVAGGTERDFAPLLRELSAELGLPEERLRWCADDGLEESSQATG